MGTCGALQGSRERILRGLTLILAPLATLTLALLGAAAAQASEQPEYYANGVLVGGPGQAIPVLYSGTIELETSIGLKNCNGKLLMYGTVWNENGHGVGQIENLSASECGWSTATQQEHPGYITSEISPVKGADERVAVVNGIEEPVYVGPVTRESAAPWRTELVNGEEEGEKVILDRIGLAANGTNCNSESLTFHEVPNGCIRFTWVAEPELINHAPPATRYFEESFWGSSTAVFYNGVKNGLSPSGLEVQGELPHSGTIGYTVVVGLNMVGATGTELIVAKG